MSAPLVPSPLDYIGRRKFTFYPPIRNIQPNEWLLGIGSWSEVQVVNAQTGLQMWISRQHIGGVSDGWGVPLVVELTKELDYASGTLTPRVKQVIELPPPAPRASKFGRRRKRRSGPAKVVGIKLEPGTDSSNRKLAKLAFGAVALCVLAAVLSAISNM